MEKEIVLARPSDIDRLVELLDQLFSQEVEFEPEAGKQVRGLEAILADKQIGEILVLKLDKKIVGMVSLLYSVSTALGGKVALLEDMVVDEEFRGRGLANGLLDRAIALAKERNCLRVTLLTDHDNEYAQRFYEKHGFERSSMVALRLLF